MKHRHQLTTAFKAVFLFALSLFLLQVVEPIVVNFFVTNIWPYVDLTNLFNKLVVCALLMAPAVGLMIIPRGYITNGLLIKVIGMLILYLFFRAGWVGGSNTEYILIHKSFGSLVYLDILFLLLPVCYYKYKKYRYEALLTFLWILLFALYWFFRVRITSMLPESRNWIILYADLICLLLVIFSAIQRISIARLFNSIFLRIAKVCPPAQNKKSSSGSFSDDPINNREEDKFQFYEAAQQLAENLIGKFSKTSKQALVIGIPATWGSGKSSFFNLLNCVFQEKSFAYKIVKFDSWDYHTEAQLVSDLLKSIAHKVNCNEELNDALYSYMKLLHETTAGWWCKLFIPFLHREHTLRQQFERINKILVSSNTNLIIEIDNMDRLTGKELLNVFKLIRNTADFKNTIYIVAYDKEYVEETLAKEIVRAKEYLEKIINMEYYLPRKSMEDLQLFYSNILNELILTKKVVVGADRWSVLIERFIKEFNENLDLRKTKRLASTLLINQYELAGLGLNLFDYLGITYIRITYPRLHSYLSGLINESPKTYEIDETNSMLRNKEGVIVLNFQKKLFYEMVKRQKESLGETVNDADYLLSKAEYKERYIAPYVEPNEIDQAYRVLNLLFAESRGEEFLSICEP
ncbi:MAG: KAP family P-loop NTPase fold protein, partial [Tannerellaceae bacterium]